ncbi:SDR family NAD(P)-dependent oxidoreductase [Chitinimonas sp. BJB300]|uniref:SDR family NAD(P)-dependent oxidoreductase n=1 Tax=Chitinimonas sp. BJB300 TaxID=1559339 RepID=UPI000C0D56F0|nr:SDR family NAD(P)-dependent oxidoreductase [Chitinimonas sp. BJB300]PHV11177.1 NAD(P)-dependent oxidoreductase [Chitinimonas sp. BJB300]TSJ87421.1 SDR family NAD(P)-dependent oxidoreductase [Chitinimonas sp. BJB300]
MQPWQNFNAPADYLKDRVILVTGAGQGLGEAAAMAFAAHGATVVLVGRNEKKLGKVYDAIEAAGSPRPAAIPLDMAKMTDQDCVNLANLIWKEFDRLDGIVHCANGFNHLSPLVNQKLEEWVDMYRVNVAAPFAINRSCLPLLKRAEDASIVFVGEQHAFDAKAYWGGFAASRAGQAALAAISADEWDKAPMPRVNLLVPGPVRTPFRTKTHPAENMDALPLPVDMTPAFLWLIGSASSATRGETLRFNPDQGGEWTNN